MKNVVEDGHPHWDRRNGIGTWDKAWALIVLDAFLATVRIADVYHARVVGRGRPAGQREQRDPVRGLHVRDDIVVKAVGRLIRWMRARLAIKLLIKESRLQTEHVCDFHEEVMIGIVHTVGIGRAIALRNGERIILKARESAKWIRHFRDQGRVVRMLVRNRCYLTNGIRKGDQSCAPIVGERYRVSGGIHHLRKHKAQTVKHRPEHLLRAIRIGQFKGVCAGPLENGLIVLIRRVGLRNCVKNGKNARAAASDQVRGRRPTLDVLTPIVRPLRPQQLVNVARGLKDVPLVVTDSEVNGWPYRRHVTHRRVP